MTLSHNPIFIVDGRTPKIIGKFIERSCRWSALDSSWVLAGTIAAKSSGPIGTVCRMFQACPPRPRNIRLAYTDESWRFKAFLSKVFFKSTLLVYVELNPTTDIIITKNRKARHT